MKADANVWLTQLFPRYVERKNAPGVQVLGVQDTTPGEPSLTILLNHRTLLSPEPVAVSNTTARFSEIQDERL